MRRSVYQLVETSTTDIPSVASIDTTMTDIGTEIQFYGNAFDDPTSEMIWEA